MVKQHDKNQDEQLRQLQKQYQALQRENLLLKIQLDASKIDSLEKASKKELAQVINELKAKYLLKDLIDALPISMSTYHDLAPKCALIIS